MNPLTCPNSKVILELEDKHGYSQIVNVSRPHGPDQLGHDEAFS